MRTTKSKNAQIQAPKRKRYHIKWKNVGLVSLCIFMGSYAFGILPIGNVSAPTPKDDSSVAVPKTDVSLPNSKSDTNTEVSATKQVRVDLSDEEMAILVLAVQHECGISPQLYLTVSERGDYVWLMNQTVLTPEEKERLQELKNICQDRKDKAQQMTAATMLNRIGKRGFGTEGYEGGVGKDLTDVLSQEGQYSEIDENGYVSESLLDDISHWTELPTRHQFNPCDVDTIANIKKVISGEVEFPTNLVYEIRSYPYASQEDAEWELKARNSYSDYVSSYEMIPVSYAIEDEYGNSYYADFWFIFGINDTGTGFAY